jgi:hypothetical protein
LFMRPCAVDSTGSSAARVLGANVSSTDEIGVALVVAGDKIKIPFPLRWRRSSSPQAGPVREMAFRINSHQPNAFSDAMLSVGAEGDRYADLLVSSLGLASLIIQARFLWLVGN